MFLKKKNKSKDEHPFHDKIAKGIAGFFIKIQTKFADTMNKKFSGLSTRLVKILLTVFCLSWGGLSGYYLFNAFSKRHQTPAGIQSIIIPRPLNKPDDEQILNHVDKETYDRIEDYKKYEDSLKQTIRPGLLDSMNLLEQIYLSQQKYK